MKKPLRDLHLRLTVLTLVASFLITPLQFAFAQGTGDVSGQSATTAQTQTSEHTPSSSTAPVAQSSPSDTQGAFDLQNDPRNATGRDKKPDKPTDPPKKDKPSPTQEPPPTVGIQAVEYPYEDERQPLKTKFQITADEPSGALTLSYPIKVPPGRKGVEPSLSLSYNSRRQENTNIAGFGWTIDIPYIERINRKGSDTLFSDFYFRSSMDDELGRKASATTTEDYGAKVETGPSRKYEFVSHQYWKVTDKQGWTYTFGTTTATRIDDPNDSTRVFRWMLEKVEDPNGNSITYEYTKDTGQIYPSLIRYTRSTGNTGIFEVEFLKEARSDIATSTAMGFPVVSKYRIYEIQTKVNSSWVRTYALGYTTGDNGVRSLLSSITETGRHEDTGATVSLPATQFSYSRPKDSWTKSNAFATSSMPFIGANDVGVRMADVNGDGLTDFLELPEADTSTKRILINNGAGWTESMTYATSGLPTFVTSVGLDAGTRLADVNGDGFPDLFQLFAQGPIKRVFINNGNDTGWTQDTRYDLSNLPSFVTGSGLDQGLRLTDINGDGLPDLIYSRELGAAKNVYINDGDGTGWTEDTSYATSAIPYFTDVSQDHDRGVRIADVNADGLDDLLQIYGSSPITGSNINDGDGTGWTQDQTYSFSGIPIFCTGPGEDRGVRVADINADGLPDLIQFLDTEPDNTNQILLNDGDGTGWTLDLGFATSTLPFVFVGGNNSDTSLRIMEVNGDGLLDLVYANSGDANSKQVWLHDGEKPDLLHTVRSSIGATTTVTYKGSAEFISGGSLMNPRLPLNLDLVEAISVNDGFGTIGTTTYTYGGGEYYFNGPYDREFALFATTTRADPLGFVTKTFYHQQGSTTQSSIGEYQDHIAKKGKPYRIEVYDASSNLYKKTINAWDRAALDYQRNFVFLARTTEMTYDGDADHKDSAETYVYASTTIGNLTYKQEWGEVTASDDGSFTASSTDRFGATYTYAASSTGYLAGLPSQETVVNSASTTVKDTKFYYDNLASGSVSKGNETKREMWKSGVSWIDIEKTYNSFGLVIQEKDPRDKATNYTYDSFNLYVATSTNPVSHTIGFVYDYSLGKPKRINNPHNYIFETTFDALDRVTEEKQPDQTTPSTSVTKAAYAYTDTIGSRSVQETRYLNAATSTDRYTYLDGLDRTIQERAEAEDANTFSAKDFQYDKRGKLHRESLLYFSTGSGRTTATSAQALFATTIYDPLDRISAVGTAVGTTTNAYDDWKTTVTDPENNIKRIARDGYGNLVRVEEVDGSSTYITAYEYNYLKNLTKITDAEANIRNFTYDGLGRRLTAEDLHASADVTYGTWTYTYDDAGNITSHLDPKSQTVNFTYDDINRVLTEDYAGTPNTEITYSYDTCDNGKGMLCGATTTSAGMNYTYDPLGEVKTERHATSTSIFTTTYTRDRQGNTIEITYPDNALVTYVYNTAGLLETISKRENGTTTPIALVEDIDYSPIGAVTYRNFGNGTETTFTYDANKLYRLTNLRTTSSTSTGETFGVGGIGLLALDEEAFFAARAEIATSSPTGDAMPQQLVSTTTSSTSTSPIESLLAGKTAAERATIKGEEIAKLGSLPRTARADYDIEAVSLRAIEGGVEVFARAWDKQGEQIGFGSDGAVDLERFRLFNPPVLVPDPLGDVVRKWTTEKGEPREQRFREDVREALLQSLEHTIKVKTQKHGSQSIMRGKIGNTTSTFHPAGGQNDPVDGYTGKGRGSWSTIRGAAAGTNGFPSSGLDAAGVNIRSVADQWEFRRSIDLFNTSSIDAGDTIDSATYSVYAKNINDGNLDAGGGVGVVRTSPASDSDIVAGDYSAYTLNNPDEGATRITMATIVAALNQYHDFSLNATGKGWVGQGTSARTRLGIRNSRDIDDSEPGLNYEDLLEYAPADTTGTTQDPKLVVEHTAASPPSSSTVLQDLSYEYDAVGNITKITDRSDSGAGKTIVFTYDDLYRLTRASTTAASSTPFLQTYTYSSLGNLTNKSDVGSYAYAGTDYANPHAATTIDGVTLTYDNNGNLTNHGTSTFRWDYRNQVTQAGTGSATSTYGYDYAGNRTSQTVGAVTTKYANKLYSSTGATTTKYIFAGDTLIATVEKTTTATTTFIVHGDHLGGSNVVSDASGNIAQVIDYYPYGSLRINVQNMSLDEKRKYIGEMYDREIALSYLNARYYDGARGRFLSQDPSYLDVGDRKFQREYNKRLEKHLSDPHALNSYSYAVNNPLKYTDPNGKLFQFIPIILFAYSIISTGIDVYDAYTTNIAYSDQFSQNEKERTLIKIGFDLATFSIGSLKALAPTKAFVFAYDILGIAVDVAGLSQGNITQTQSNQQFNSTSNTLTPAPTPAPPPPNPVRSTPSQSNQDNNDNTLRLQELQRQANHIQRQIDALKWNK